IAWDMIPFVPIAFAVLALLAWRWDARERRAYEATLSEAEKRQLRAPRRGPPPKRRGALPLRQAETPATAAPDAPPPPPKDPPETHQAENGRKTPALNVREEDFAMPIALTTPQLNQVRTIAAQVPRHLRAQFLSRLAELLPQEFGEEASAHGGANTHSH